MAFGILSLLAAAPYAALAAAYSFNFTSTPRQCQNLSIEIDGTGSPPYSALIIPFGPSPLPNSIEARRITNVPFSGNSTSVSFQLKFPENSQFVAVVSDSTGFGTGGTSATVTVLSGDAPCFDTTQSVQPAFLFHTDPDHVLITCSPSRLWWDNSTVQGTATFQGVIPGGQSFQIPEGPITPQAGEGVGFQWTPSVRVGTLILLVGGDDRGLGSAGSNQYTMQAGNSLSCLNDTSPSSTPGSPAGGSYPTATDGSGVNTGSSSSSSHTNVGAIVGGVIGGVVGAIALGLVILFAIRRQRFHQGTKERPVDLLQDQDNEVGHGDGRPPEYYQPEPFVLPDPTVASTRDGSVAGAAVQPGLATRPSADHRQSYVSTSTSETGGAGLRPPASSVPSTSARKSPAPPSFRPVNIIQHDDAGPPDPPPPPPEEPETIELPPAYTNIRRGAPPPSSAPNEEGGVGAVGATTQVPQAAQA